MQKVLKVTQILFKNGKPIFHKTISEDETQKVSDWFLGSSFRKMGYTMEVQVLMGYKSDK